MARTRSNSPDHNAKGTQSEDTPPEGRGLLLPLVGVWFQELFTPRTGVLFTRPSRYSSAIGHTGVFSLGGWSPQLRARFLGPGATQDRHLSRYLAFAYGALTRYGAPFQGTSADFTSRFRGSYNPGVSVKPRFGHHTRSLAATWVIAIAFSSSRY
jgi:hypothetical protein